MYYDELPAGSKEAAAEYFIDHKRDDVDLVRVEFIGPDDSGVREYERGRLQAMVSAVRGEHPTSNIQSAENGDRQDDCPTGVTKN